MKVSKNIDVINDAYRTIHERTEKLVNMLAKLELPVEWGFKNQHYVMVGDEPMFEYYPIPVITIGKVCSIGIDFMRVFAEGRLAAEDVKSIDLPEIKKYSDFEIFAESDPTENLYFENSTIEELAGAVNRLSGDELLIRLSMQGEPTPEEILKAVKLLEAMGTHSDPSVCIAERVEVEAVDENAPAFVIANELMKN